ncbi:putative quinol monooxygenase [Paenibacillus sp. GCM10027627]|uniref:putative quinol monooxygenase n=1 Tax=unclassified Paenibacillus TaxID=185978 RepID=UPI003633718C
MSKYTMYGRLIAKPGKRDELAAILLQAADALGSNPDCELYIVNISEDDPDSVWVTELWSNEAAHAASLKDEETIALIGVARPLIAGVEPIKLKPIGGKGL